MTSSADFFLNLGCGSTGNAAAVVGHGEEAVFLERDADMVGMAGHRLVHGVVEHLGEEVVHRLLVGAADIHAGAPAHGLQALQHLDVGGGVSLLGTGSGISRSAACLPGLIGLRFNSSSSLANRSRDEAAALRMGLFDTNGSTNL